MEPTTRRYVLRILSAALLAFAVFVGLPTAHGDVRQCADIAQTHSAGEPASHHQPDATHEACCGSICMACMDAAAPSAEIAEAEFPGASLARPSTCLSGRTPSPGFEPPRSIA
ncbi:hypothetical protein LXM94_06635 [Rhizobium sp. TRM95111]|uniref:hypothetical protein n=1 Tax=Rhizobium alarense TaxID=2846851 RepID=UPI001F1809D4|nr:hypothetical protein [Rhizobium alarense]MCF3639642.1 hypothetical protein [Rhizobium alarense]